MTQQATTYLHDPVTAVWYDPAEVFEHLQQQPAFQAMIRRMTDDAWMEGTTDAFQFIDATHLEDDMSSSSRLAHQQLIRLREAQIAELEKQAELGAIQLQAKQQEIERLQGQLANKTAKAEYWEGDAIAYARKLSSVLRVIHTAVGRLAPFNSPAVQDVRKMLDEAKKVV